MKLSNIIGPEKRFRNRTTVIHMYRYDLYTDNGPKRWLYFRWVNIDDPVTSLWDFNNSLVVYVGSLHLKETSKFTYLLIFCR